MKADRTSHTVPTTHCPSCGRFVGAQTTCPYCGAHVSKRLSLRLFRYGAIILAILGLIALWIAARSADIPAIQIQEIGSTMNWAYVKLEGIVVRPPAYDAQTEYLKFWLYDGTGEIMVAAYRNESRALLETGTVPAMGDRVTVEGTLKVKEDFESLTLNVPERLIIDRPQAVESEIGGIGLEQLYQKVQISGEVREVKIPYEGLTILTVRDRTGEIDVTYTADLVRLSGAPIEVVPGDAVSVRGAVSLYGETPQIALDTADGLQRAQDGVDIALPKAIGEIGSDDIDRMVRVEGAITDEQWISAGLKFTLDDGTGSIPLLLWQSVLDNMLDRVDLRPGTWLEVRALVSEYKGELELVPEMALDVRITQARPEVITPLPLAEIAADHEGSIVNCEGQIVRVTPFSSGTKFTMQDGQATLTMVFWENLLAACPDKDRLVPGAWVSVQGEIQQYKEELEIIPGHADDVVWIEMRELPAAEQRPIGEIGEQDVAHTYQIEGQITAVNAFSSGVRWTVQDDTGSIVVLLWENVLAPLSQSFEVGTRVRVSGEVAQYKGTLEIIPAVPGDIVWLAAGAPPTSTPTPTSEPSPTAAPTATPTQQATPTPTVEPTATAAPTAPPTPTPTPGVQTTSTGSVSADQIGQQLTVEGQIVEATLFASGAKLYVDDGTGKVVLWIPQELYAQLTNAAQLITGSTVRATGVVEEYNGEMEVVPQAAGDVIVVAAAPPPVVTVTRISELSAENVGQTVTVQGQIVEVTPFSKGTKYLLDDGSARITLLLWQNVLDTVPNKEGLVVGATVQATGKVDEFNGELEIAPGMGADVAIQ